MEYKDIQKFNIENISNLIEIELNDAVLTGPQGISPIVSVNTNTDTEYTLIIKCAESVFVTPNLKGKDGVFNTFQLSVLNPSDESISGLSKSQSEINKEIKASIEMILRELNKKLDKPVPEYDETGKAFYSLSKDLTGYLFGSQDVEMNW